ncbi:MAG: NAD(P)H-dependent glycerol-3-phosphate dehydrogenase [Phycisphaerales bacterium]
MERKVTILGDGQMGLVLARTVVEQGCACSLWGPFADAVAGLAARRSSGRLPQVRLQDEVHVTADAAAALAGATLVVSAIPTQFMRGVWERVGPHRPAAAAVASVAKGFERGSHVRPTQILADAGVHSPAVLTGPTIAAELARRLPAVMVAASADPAVAERVQSTFATPWLRIYTSGDVVGAEVAGALKNIIALAAGMVDGLALGCNAKSALLARGLAEMVRLGTALGARAETFFGVAGVGDLATTCFSPEGRNRSCGEALGRGLPLEAALAATDSVVEGVETARSVRDLARELGVEMPITEAVCRIAFERQPPLDAIRDLMGRAARSERVG